MNRIGAVARTSGAGWGRRWTDRMEAAGGERRRPRPAAAFVAQLLAARLEHPLLDEAAEAGLAEARYHAASPEARPARQGSLVRLEA